MKKFTVLLIFIVTMLLSGAAWAAPAAKALPIDGLPNVAVLYVNNAKTTYDRELDEAVLSNLVQALPASQYNYVDGAPYVEKLSKIGITDITTAERADILATFAGENIDYVVFVEIQPLVVRDKLTLFSVGKDVSMVVPLKVIDLGGNRYLYNGKFTEKASDSTFIGGIGNKSVALKALQKINIQLRATLAERLPKVKPAK